MPTTFYGALAPAPQAGQANDLLPHALANKDVKCWIRDRQTLNASSGDTLVLGDVPLDGVPLPALCTITYGAAGTGVTVNVGDANDNNNLVAAQSIAAAGSASLMAAVAAANIGDPFWKILGYATRDAAIDAAKAAGHPKYLRILAAIGGANFGGATSIAWSICGTGA